ncbi:MAG: sulfatase-like hydrolase/transferase [Eubacteriales bacterium]
MNQQDNILFIFTDQWQSQATGFHGHSIVKTPNLDELAKISVDFSNSFTVCPLCTPARGSIFTGLYPHQSGIIDNCDVGATSQEYLPESSYTWLDAMADSGRKVGHFGKWHLGHDWYPSRKDIEFELLRVEGDPVAHKTRVPSAKVTERGQLNDNNDLKSVKKNADSYPPFYGKLESIEERYEHRITERSLQFLDEHGENPWCLTVSLVGPHFPNLNPEPYYSMYNSSEIELPVNFSDRFINKPWFQNRRWWPSVMADEFDSSEWKKTTRAYYGSITMMDYFIGTILEKAKLCSHGRKTRVVFTADHGEMMGSHSRFDKSAYFYEEVLKTPLLICDDLSGTQEGFQRNEFCNTLDISQTFFSMAGKKAINGRDLCENLDKSYKDNTEDEVFSNYYKYNGHSFEIRTLRTARYKYSFVPQDIDELYDLENDPHELVNLSDHKDYIPIKRQMKEKIFTHMRENGDYLLNILDDLPSAGVVGKPEYPTLKLNYSS